MDRLPVFHHPKVSVVVITYNQANFIKTCLNSILNQQTTFPFEVLIGEDESSDGTREICQEYAQQYPDTIRLFLRKRKHIIYVDGQATGRYNFCSTLRAATGKYIALCDGDDYWTDPLKLEKQVTFLETNLDYSLCFHKVKYLFPDGILREDNSNFLPTNHENVKAFASYGNYIFTSSVVFKNIIDDYPSDFYRSPAGDSYLFFLLALRGKMKFLTEQMSIYRQDIGIWSSKPYITRQLMTIKIFGYLYRYCIDFQLDEQLCHIFVNRIKIILEDIKNDLKEVDFLQLGIILLHPKSKLVDRKKMTALYDEVVNTGIAKKSKKYILDFLNINKPISTLFIRNNEILSKKAKEVQLYINNLANQYIKKLGELPINNVEVIHYWDLLKVNNSVIYIRGWGYLKDTNNTFLETKYLLFHSNRHSYIYPLISVLRKDISSWRNNGNDYDDCGFNTKIDISTLNFSDEKYTIGLYIVHDDGHTGFVLSNTSVSIP